MVNDKRIRVIVGHYGSGKTEFSVNYVMKLSETHENVAIADLDVVNVYFRSREKAEIMEEKGIKVLSSAFGHHANLDLPAIASGILGFLQDENCNVVLDIGGDSTGARVLARYKQIIEHKGYDMFVVVNAFRAETQNKEGVLRHISELEDQTGLKVTGLINNSHLLRETSLDDIKTGQDLIKSVSDELNIPIKYVCAIEKIAKEIPSEYEGEVFPIKMYMREEWM